MITHHGFDCNPPCVCLWNSDTLFICTVIELKDETPAWITVTDTEFCTEPHQTCTFICIITKSIFWSLDQSSLRLKLSFKPNSY